MKRSERRFGQVGKIEKHKLLPMVQQVHDALFALLWSFVQRHALTASHDLLDQLVSLKVQFGYLLAQGFMVYGFMVCGLWF